MSVTRENFHGRSAYASIAADYTLVLQRARAWAIENTVPGSAVVLPDARTLRLGGPQVAVLNAAALLYVGVKDNVSGVLLPTGGAGSLTPGDVVFLWLVDNSTRAGVWRWIVRTPFTTSPVNNRLLDFYVSGGNGTEGTSIKWDGSAWAAGPAIGSHRDGCFLPLGVPMGGGALLVGTHPFTLPGAAACQELLDGGIVVARTAHPSGLSRALGAGIDGIGYAYGSTGVATSWKYVRDAWAALRDLPAKFSDGSAARVGDKLILLTGEPRPYPAYAHRTDEGQIDCLITLAAPVTTRKSFCSFETGGQFVVVGGQATGLAASAVDVVEAYTPATDSWATKAAFPYGARFGAAGAGLNRRGYVAGGKDALDVAKSDFASYAIDAWSAGAGMTAARYEIANQGVGM